MGILKNMITAIHEVYDFRIAGSLYGEKYDGYEIVTPEHTYRILIENEQNCCESWGYFSSDDNLDGYVGENLVGVELTDKALNRMKFEQSGYYDEDGGIQFVDFKMASGRVLQFAVYNAHNGYYGHSIIVAKDDDIVLSKCL